MTLIILDMRLDLNEQYRVELKVYDVKKNPRYPEGVKVRFVLIDQIQKQPVLLLDNHAPLGFHIHSKLPHHPEVRESLSIQSYPEALMEFQKRVKDKIQS